MEIKYVIILSKINIMMPKGSNITDSTSIDLFKSVDYISC
uniref:Uncharacterized protein n=1 Tax=Manihot esculenta TaxID=3983 RepID=A0A2C9VW00_MANES